MINDIVIRDYVEDYILNNGWSFDDFNVDEIVEVLHHVALVCGLVIEVYEDCDAFPMDDFEEAFVVA